MDTRDWDEKCSQVKSAMERHVHPFVTPISMSMQHGHGEAWASGTFLELGGIPCLLTNEHVYRTVPFGGALAYLPVSRSDYAAIYTKPAIAKLPVDAALFELRDSSLKAAPQNYLDLKYAPAPRELLFWFGYPGTTAGRHDLPTEGQARMTRFGSALEVPGRPMLSQELLDNPVLHDSYSAEHHVALVFPSEGKLNVETVGPLPNPKGMSGSTLWDSKFVASGCDLATWSPEKARICGLAWAALDSPAAILATRIEHVIAALSPLSAALAGRLREQ